MLMVVSMVVMVLIFVVVIMVVMAIMTEKPGGDVDYSCKNLNLLISCPVLVTPRIVRDILQVFWITNSILGSQVTC